MRSRAWLARNTCGYHAGSRDATEPVALAALALVACGRESRALPLLDWLSERQGADGSLGVDAENATPGWPTGWAMIAWQAAQNCSLAQPRFAAALEHALAWIFRVQGEIIERVESAGHDTMIKGWPWVEGTHAWVEPTAINLLALKHTGHGSHRRAREAVRLLHDRMLPSGGCNYGNTVVFGQELRPHVQPTGLCLLALAGEDDASGRTDKSIDYLRRELSARTTTESLCYALLGLAAHEQASRRDRRLAGRGRASARCPAIRPVTSWPC